MSSKYSFPVASLADYAKNLAWSASTGAGIAFGVFLASKLTNSSVSLTINAKK